MPQLMGIVYFLLTLRLGPYRRLELKPTDCYTSSAVTATANGTPIASKCFCPQRTLSASLVRSFRKSRVPLVSRTKYSGPPFYLRLAQSGLYLADAVGVGVLHPLGHAAGPRLDRLAREGLRLGTARKVD